MIKSPPKEPALKAKKQDVPLSTRQKLGLKHVQTTSDIIQESTFHLEMENKPVEYKNSASSLKGYMAGGWKSAWLFKQNH